MTSETKICVVGTGHIGLPLAAVLAEAGFWVTGYDTNDDFIVRVNTTRTVDFQEEGLAALLERNLHNRLTLTSTPPRERSPPAGGPGRPGPPGTRGQTGSREARRSPTARAGLAPRA